jgi:hypothetical protein
MYCSETSLTASWVPNTDDVKATAERHSVNRNFVVMAVLINTILRYVLLLYSLYFYKEGLLVEARCGRTCTIQRMLDEKIMSSDLLV